MKRIGFVLGAMVLLAVTLSAAPGLAGDLNPPGAPAPTMKTLDQIPPTWDQIIPDSNNRFKSVMGGAAVLDKETGLVWEASPDTEYRPWRLAHSYCIYKDVGNRMGWRLPTIQELLSLVDRSVSGSLKLAANFATYFSNVQSSLYWSATTFASDTGIAWLVSFGGGLTAFDKTGTFYVWCVRGGSGLEAQ